MTDLDDMANDILLQSDNIDEDILFPSRKPRNEYNDLTEMKKPYGRYRGEKGADEFDIDYRTYDKRIADLLPEEKDIIIVHTGDTVYDPPEEGDPETYKKMWDKGLSQRKYSAHGAHGSYSKSTDKLELLDRNEFLAAGGSRKEYFEAKIHENIHRGLGRADVKYGVQRDYNTYKDYTSDFFKKYKDAYNKLSPEVLIQTRQLSPSVFLSIQ